MAENVLILKADTGPLETAFTEFHSISERKPELRGRIIEWLEDSDNTGDLEYWLSSESLTGEGAHPVIIKPGPRMEAFLAELRAIS